MNRLFCSGNYRRLLKANLTSDQYSLQTILVNQGDKVIVNLYNMEAPSGDMHSFTIDAPYNVNIDIAPRHNETGVSTKQRKQQQ